MAVVGNRLFTGFIANLNGTPKTVTTQSVTAGNIYIVFCSYSDSNANESTTLTTNNGTVRAVYHDNGGGGFSYNCLWIVDGVSTGSMTIQAARSNAGAAPTSFAVDELSGVVDTGDAIQRSGTFGTSASTTISLSPLSASTNFIYVACTTESGGTTQTCTLPSGYTTIANARDTGSTSGQLWLFTSGFSPLNAPGGTSVTVTRTNQGAYAMLTWAGEFTAVSGGGGTVSRIMLMGVGS